MLQNAYLVPKIGADTAENERHFAEILLRRPAQTSERGLPPWHVGRPPRRPPRGRGLAPGGEANGARCPLLRAG